jgi:hypothetical protein
METIWWGNPKEGAHQEELGTDGRKNTKAVLKE